MKKLATIALLVAMSACAEKPEPVCGPPDASLGEGTVATAGDAPWKTLPPSGEGMWPWDQLDELDEAALKERGLEVPLKDLWTPGKGGLAGAAVGLRGCSASFVSGDGLMITNHHCAFRGIQRNSTEDNNILENGFLASSKEEELDGHGLRAYVFVEQTDITEKILGDLPDDLDDLARMKAIEDREKAVVKKCEEKPSTRCRVSRNNDGLSFILLENLEIKDVRLVAVPPLSLGEFGGEVDNWQWPRHTMDFTFLRAYVDKEGKPAAYSKDNVPYSPAHHFKVGTGGVTPGDLVMVVGTPYRTARYRTLASVKEDLEWYYPNRERLFKEWLQVLDKTCEDVPEACLPTASAVKTLNNALTNAVGMIAGLNRAQILDRKEAQEKEWRDWVAKEDARKAKWGDTLNELSEYFEKNKAGRDSDLLLRYLLWGNKMTGFARTLTKWHSQQALEDEKREQGFQERDRKNVRDDLVQAQRSLHLEADRRVLAMFLARFGELPVEERPAAFEKALGGNYSSEAIEAYTEKLYKGSKLGGVETREKLFDGDAAGLEASTDTFVRLGLDLAAELDAYDQRKKSKKGALSRLRPPYIESLVEMMGKHFYPDANASPRISFATVTGYSPKDGVYHTPRTTLSGLVAKVTDQKPFNAPKTVVDAVEAGRLPYSDPELKDVPVCFLSNADTTGGNSGSPALNANGQLVGLNFDRVYENISGDYGYNPERSRNIMVEVRSVLWYLKEIAGADNVLKELGAEK